MSIFFLVMALAICDCTTGTRVRRSDDANPLESVVEQQGRLITEMNAKITAMEAAMAEYQRLVVFMVNVAATQNVSAHQRLNFGSPSLNVGGGFHTTTDSFVAPVSGLYMLFLKVTGREGANIRVGIYQEGNLLAETETNDNDSWDRSSVQIVVKVSAGQSVWVEKSGGGGTEIIGGIPSAFGGFLLRAGDSF